MANMTVRNVPDEVQRALRLRAARHGRSTEAEVRAILAGAVNEEKRLLMGEALAKLGRKIGLTDEDAAALERARHKTSAKPLRFKCCFSRLHSGDPRYGPIRSGRSESHQSLEGALAQ